MTTGNLFSLVTVTGLELRQLPRGLRDEEGYAVQRSLAALCSDPTLAAVEQRALVIGPAAKRLGSLTA